ncbi:hypothetical protein PR048_018235 [Dryococelus australis]|uniref:Uncharacterized protein n=1 Tax=Dryococelus australis TaxID=614101 RepID=A0ABQ9HBV9_9NEOP|nr:hypothetical protein PR048_018235 [Dryococelus australis]
MKRTLVINCCIISASGVAWPPSMVFPQIYFKENMLKGAPPSTLGLAAQSGWMKHPPSPYMKLLNMWELYFNVACQTQLGSVNRETMELETQVSAEHSYAAIVTPQLFRGYPKKASDRKNIETKKEDSCSKKYFFLEGGILVSRQDEDSNSGGEKEDSHFDPEHRPRKGDYVLVKFSGKSDVRYVGKLLSNEDNEDDYAISYLRKSHKTEKKYLFPQEPGVASVNKMDIVMSLPSPQKIPGTKRQKSYISFSINLGNYNEH